jgi:hypothetical protein
MIMTTMTQTVDPSPRPSGQEAPRLHRWCTPEVVHGAILLY